MDLLRPDKQMSLTDKVNKIAVLMDELKERGVASVHTNYATKQYEALFVDAESFYKEWKGEPLQFLEVDGMQGEVVEVCYERFGILYKVVLFSKAEYKTLQENMRNSHHTDG